MLAMIRSDDRAGVKRREPPNRFATVGASSPALGESAGALGRARLWLRVHFDAFRLDPLGYLQAVLWRARGLRLRSRNRMATLAGQSPAAYDFWVACREPKLRLQANGAQEGGATLIVVVDARNRPDRLADTLASSPSGAAVAVIGGPAAEGTIAIDSIAELASHCGEEELWLIAIESGDKLAPNALDGYRSAIAANGDTDVIYADDDLIGPDAKRRHPHFKPSWNPELFEHHDYISGGAAVRVHRERLLGLEGQDWAKELVTSALGRSTPVHVPLVLHHRLARRQPQCPRKPATIEVAGWPLVSVIIPTRNHADLLAKCLAGVETTDYPKIEVIVVDNDSDEPEAAALLARLASSDTAVIRAEGPFNYSRLNNLAVRQAKGGLLCFLNNDIEMIDPDWLRLLASHAVRPDIGAVGARLLYPDGTIQHAGVCTGVGGGAAHAHRYQRHDETGYFERANLPQRVTAVTAACLVVEREKFLSVDGFDEEDFPVAFNDVDLCLKLNERGWQSFYEPRATLIHHESKSRGSDRHKLNRVRFAGELARLKRKWQTDVSRDPFHHPQLSPFCEQFLIAV